MMGPALLVALVLALLSGAAAPRVQATASEPARAAKSLPPVLGISYRSPRGTLAWFDPLTLKTLPGRKAPLGGHLGSWAFSGDRALLAVSSCADEPDPVAVPGIRFVNARAMRVLGDRRLSTVRGCSSSLTWLRPRRLLTVVETLGDASLVLVDPAARRVLRREPLASHPWATGSTRDELVLLLGNDGSIAPARLAVIDSEGRTRIQTVDRIVAGTSVDQESGDHRSRIVEPGLAVDPDGRRAFLVPPAGPAAEIDLETLAVTYHELDRPSLLQRFLRWLVPAAQAKEGIEGPVRWARWLGDGMIAVSGVDYSIASATDDEERVTAAPVGLTLLDTRSWTTRLLDRETSGFAVVPGLVVAQGGRWDSGQERGYGPGLRAFGLDGRERWRLHPGEYRWLDPAGLVGYVYLGEGRAEVVDLESGQILATIRRSGAVESWPLLLAAQSSGS